MRGAVRIGILVLALAQAWVATVATRYSLAYGEGIEAARDYRQAEAWEAFDRARRLNPAHCDIWTWAGDAALALGEAAFDAGSNDAAELGANRAFRDYTGAVLRCPRDSWSWSGLAAAAMLRSKLSDRGRELDLERIVNRTRGILEPERAVARAAAGIAVALNPGGYVELDVLAEIHEANGDLDAAREAFVESARRMPAPSFHSWGGGRKLSQGLYQAVLGGLEQGLNHAPPGERSMIGYQIGKFAFAQGDPDTALRYLEQSLALAATPYETFQASWEFAIVLQDQGRLAAARDALLRAKASGYAADLVRRRLGQIAMLLGDFPTACAELRAALRALSSETGLRLQASSACEASGDPVLAERLLRRGFVLPEDNLTVARALLEYYRRNERNHTAAGLARRWAQHSDLPELQAWQAEFDVGGL